jgi:acetyl-CoA carboxylase carboxyltransferase component
MMDIINRLVDNSEFEAYKDGYGQTIITGYARIDGWAVGIVQPTKVVKTKKGEMQFGGVIYSVLTKPLALSLIATKRKFP